MPDVLVLFESGPAWKPQYSWQCDSLLAGAWPEHKRAGKDMESLEAGGRTPNCFLTAVYSEHGLPL